MNNKNTSMIATIVAVVFCGCPGLFGLCFGLTSLFASAVPGANIDIGGNSDPAAAMTMGLGVLCLSVIFIAIPIITWFVTRSKKSTESPEANVPNINEPLPPAS